MGKTSKENLIALRREVEECIKCELWRTRTNIVFGEGNVDARTMIISEAPGFNEDKTGRPFCGAAGEILDELLRAAKLERTRIYITNILKCRPPGNRNPHKDEIKACSPYLDRQIRLIRPKVICCLGNFAAAYILEKFGLKEKIRGMSKIHGKVFNIGKIKIIPLYHPAVATYNPKLKPILIRDFRKLEKL